MNRVPRETGTICACWRVPPRVGEQDRRDAPPEFRLLDPPEADLQWYDRKAQGREEIAKETRADGG